MLIGSSRVFRFTRLYNIKGVHDIDPLGISCFFGFFSVIFELQVLEFADVSPIRGQCCHICVAS